MDGEMTLCVWNRSLYSQHQRWPSKWPCIAIPVFCLLPAIRKFCGLKVEDWGGWILLRWPYVTSAEWLWGPITPSSWSVLPWSVLSPLNSWWPLVYKEGTSGSGVVTQEIKWTGLKYPGSQWHLQERSQIRSSHARVLIPQICSMSPHPFLSSAICQRPREGWHPYQSRGWHWAQGQHWQNAHFFGWFTELITPPSALALSSSFLSNILSS